MSDQPSTANEIVNAPDRVSRVYLVLIAFGIAWGGSETYRGILHSQFQADQIRMQSQIKDLYSSVAMMTEDHIRLDSLVEKNQEVSELIQAQNVIQMNSILFTMREIQSTVNELD